MNWRFPEAYGLFFGPETSTQPRDDGGMVGKSGIEFDRLWHSHALIYALKVLFNDELNPFFIQDIDHFTAL